MKKLIKIILIFIELTPRNICLKISIIDVIGFKDASNLYRSGIMLRGKTMGVANIHICIKKGKAKFKSLYFAVTDEINVPKPKLNSAN